MKIVERVHFNCFVQTQHIEISLFESIMNGRTQQPLYILDINHIKRANIVFVGE